MSDSMPSAPEAYPTGPPPPYNVAGGDNEQDKGYPAQQAGYSPHQGHQPQPGYPPMQPGYPPTHPGYPPMQPGYQGGAYPPGYGQPPVTNQPGMYPGLPGPGQHSSTVIVQQPVAIVQPFREVPVQTLCPQCHASIVTGTIYETGTLAWVICAVICLVGCDLGCCLIPFCVDSCKDVVHVCPNCQHTIARFNRL